VVIDSVNAAIKILYIICSCFATTVDCEPRRSGFKFQIAVVNVLCDVPNTGVFSSVSTKCVHGMTSSSVSACKAGCQVPSRRRTASKDLCGLCRRPLTARRNPIVVGHVLRNFNRLTYDCGAASTKTTFRMVSPPIKTSLVRWNKVLGVILFVLFWGCIMKRSSSLQEP